MQPVPNLTENLPSEIQTLVLRKAADNYLQFRTVSKRWKSLIEGDRDYWARRFVLQFHEFSPLLHNIQKLPPFESLLNQEPPCLTSVYSILKKTQHNFLGYPTVQPLLLIGEPVKDMILHCDETGNKAIFYINEEGSLKKAPLLFKKNTLKVGEIQTLAHFPKDPLHLLVSLGKGVMAGSDAGMLYDFFISENGEYFPVPMLEKPLADRIISIETAREENARHLIVITYNDAYDGFKTLFYSTNKQGEAMRITPAASYLRGFPVFIESHLALCANLEGGFLVFNFKDGSTISRFVQDEKNTLLKDLTVTKLCRVADKIVFTTGQGQVGWFDKSLLLATQPTLHWIKEPSPFLPDPILHVLPLGTTGVSLHYKSGLMEPILFEANGNAHYGRKLQREMIRPIWLENQKLIYLQPASHGSKVFSLDYSTPSSIGPLLEFKDTLRTAYEKMKY